MSTAGRILLMHKKISISMVVFCVLCYNICVS